jgi:excisionase family DNA binding protein
MIDAQAKELLTVPEAAAFLRLQPSTIRAWVCQRRIPFIKLGRLVRIRRIDAEALLLSSSVPARLPSTIGESSERD